jgi:sugar/nucleoside kinase (ribokinase family)
MIGVVGSVARDVIDGGAPRVGGAAYYCGRALAVLGQPAVVVTKYAADDHRLTASLHGLGVRVEWRPASSTVGFRIDNRPGERLMALEDAGEPWTPEEMRSWVGEALGGAAWVHAGALTRADFPPRTLEELARGRRVSLDGQGLVRRPRVGPLEMDADFDPTLLRHVTILKLSEDEATVLDVGSLAVPEIVVTLGSRGARVYAEGREEHVGTRPLDLLDPTGAGDAFAAAYLIARSSGQDPFAAAGSANVVTRGLLSRWRSR